MRLEAYLSYPFPHVLEDRELVEDPVKPGSEWAHWFSRLSSSSGNGGELVTDHSYSFLPQVRKLLFPELVNRSSQEAKELLATLPKCDLPSVRQHFTGHDEGKADRFLHTCTRLTWHGEILGPGHRLPVTVPTADRSGTEQQALEVRWTDALLFPGGVGVLLVALSLPEVKTTEAAARVLRHVKKIEHRRRLNLEVTAEQFEGMNLTGSAGPTTWAEVIDTVLAPLSHASDDPNVSISEVTGTLGFNWRMAVVAAVDDVAEGDMRSPFGSVGEQASFALATGHMAPLCGTHNLPGNAYWERLRSANGLALWHDWQMLYHYDNLVQVITSRDTAYVTHQFENFEHEYLSLFVLVTAQRYAIDLMHASAATIAGSVAVSTERVNQLENDLMRFSTRLWHSGVSTTPVGDPLYEVLCSTHGLPQTLGDLKNDMESIRVHLGQLEARRVAKSGRRTQRLIQALAFVVAPVGLLVTVLQPRLSRHELLTALSPGLAWLAVIAVTLVATAIWGWLALGATDDEEEF